jgi:hypothetical protein
MRYFHNSSKLKNILLIIIMLAVGSNTTLGSHSGDLFVLGSDWNLAVTKAIFQILILK